MFICILAFYYEIGFQIRSTIDECRHYDTISIPIITWCLNTITPQNKRDKPGSSFIQCRYGLSGVILFIFLIILNIWIYCTITFCRFTFCFYILMAKQMNQRKRSVFNETHLQKISFENWRTTKLCEKKERTSKQCHEFVKK